MGLDMYLYAEDYVNKYHYWINSNDETETTLNENFAAISKALDCEHLIEDMDWTGYTVQIPIGYWRKANAIHAWIISNVANKIDDCQRIRMRQEHLIALRKVCNEALANPESAHHILPPQAGFFFGSTEIDEWYWNSIHKTIEIVNKVLSEDKAYDIYYQASW